MKTRLFGYCRVSTQRQAERGYSLDDQERRIRSYVDTYYDEGTYSLEILRDEGKSGKNLDRPMMRKLIAEAQTKKVDVIIFYCLNRLTRSVKDTIYLMELVNSCGVEFVSISENLDTTSAMGRYFITTLSAIAQLEREQDGERAKRGIIEGAKQGNYVRPRAPFGYYRDPVSNKSLIIDEDKAKIVRSVFESIAYDGETINSIATKLKTEKIYDLKWNERSIYKMVNNKIYYGCLEVGGKEFENNSPAIIDKELFEEVQEKVNNTKKYNRHHYLFKNKVRCNECKCLCKVATGTSANGTVYKYYRCPECHRQIGEHAIIEQIVQEFTELLQHNYYSDNMDLLKKRHGRLRTKLDNLSYAFIKYDIGRDVYEDMMDSLSEEKDVIEKEIMKMQKGIVKIDFLDIGFTQQLEFVKRYIDYVSVDFRAKSATVVYFKKPRNEL